MIRVVKCEITLLTTEIIPASTKSYVINENYNN